MTKKEDFMIVSRIANALIDRSLGLVNAFAFCLFLYAVGSLGLVIAFAFCLFLYAVGYLAVTYSKGERIVITAGTPEASTECTQAASCPNVVPES